MTTEATSLLSKPLDALAHMVARSPVFQTWCGVNSDEEALTRVHILTTPINPVMPFALVDFGDKFARQRVALGNKISFDFSKESELWVYFRAAVQPEVTDYAAAIAFLNSAGLVIADLEKDAGQQNSKTLSMQDWYMSNLPTRTDSQDRKRAGDYFEMAIAIPFTQANS